MQGRCFGDGTVQDAARIYDCTPARTSACFIRNVFVRRVRPDLRGFPAGCAKGPGMSISDRIYAQGYAVNHYDIAQDQYLWVFRGERITTKYRAIEPEFVQFEGLHRPIPVAAIEKVRAHAI